MRIYTKTGDKGFTGLYGPFRAGKGDPIIEAIGSVDELNSQIGWASCFADDTTMFAAIQNDLLQVGAVLAGQEYAGLTEMIGTVEQWIDECDDDLPPLDCFILPQGTQLACALHVCRAVCRRAERAVARHYYPTAPDQAEAKPYPVLVYLNRLSDLLFVLARWANQKKGIKEKEWTST